MVEGHVPLSAVRRLFAEKPAVKGIALPGMLEGSPGLSGPNTIPFIIQSCGAGAPKVFISSVSNGVRRFLLHLDELHPRVHSSSSGGLFGRTTGRSINAGV